MAWQAYIVGDPLLTDRGLDVTVVFSDGSHKVQRVLTIVEPTIEALASRASSVVAGFDVDEQIATELKAFAGTLVSGQEIAINQPKSIDEKAK